jgi:GNAT superfamily N-acetyltransferase
MEHHFTISEESFLISDDKALLNIKAVHQYLSEESYWSKDIPFRTVKDAIENSLCIGVYFKSKTIGFARIITDFATFAYLCDVYVLNEFRGKGISKQLMKFIMQHHKLKGLRRWMLMTKNAHGLYQQFGWYPLASAEKAMEINYPDIYQKDKIE